MDDADIHGWLAGTNGDGSAEAMAKTLGELYRAFKAEGFSVDQAFELAKEAFTVLLDTIELAHDTEDDDD